MDGDSIRKLADEIFCEKVLRARELTIEQRIRAGGDLFDQMSGVSKDGIRHQNPATDEATVPRLFAERMRTAE